MSRWTCKWFFLSVILLALVVGGCGGNGNGGGMAGGGTPDPEPEPMCPAGQTGTYPNCMTPPPPAPAGGHNAVIDGIVNPETAGDPSTAQGTVTDEGSTSRRPGEATGEAFDVTQGVLGKAPTTTIGSDTLDKDDMTNDTPPKSVPDQFMDQNMDSMLGGFAGSVHEKMTSEGDKKVVDTINVFTNMDAATSATYAMYYDGTASRDGVTAAAGEEGLLTLGVDGETGMLSLFSGSKLPTGAGQNINIPADNTETTNVKENEFTGMFNGVAGTYACTAGTGCSARTDAMSKLTLTGAWTFKPTETDPMKIMLPGVQYDNDYLSFGYWVRTTGEGDDTKYGVGTFFDGSQAFSGTITNLEGTATYSGKAAGMYGRKTLNQYGQVVEGGTTSGHFTADANLTARFSGQDVPARNANQVEGTVTNFMDGGEMISPGWSVEFEKDAIEGNTVGGSTTGDGNWRATFFGTSMTDGSPTANDPATAYAENAPTGVAGDFTAHFANGHVIGAFGATRDKK